MADHDVGGTPDHPPDGTLLRRLDGALAPGEETEVAAHLERCAPCRARLASLQERGAAVRAWIREGDPEPPAREGYDLGAAAGRNARARRPDRWAVAAAAVAVLVAGAVSATLLGRVLRDDTEVAREPAPEATAGPGETAATSFIPPGDELAIAFETPSAGGAITLRPASGPAATLRVDSRDVELLVEGSTVHVRDAVPGGAAYELAVPASVRVVRLRAPGAPDVVEDVAGLSTERTIRLPP